MTRLPVILRLALIALLATGPGAAMAEGAALKDMRRKVIAGDRIIVQGVEIRLKDTHCPPPSTAEAQEARRIMGIILFARKLQCTYKPGPQGNVGDCIYGPSSSSRIGRSMAGELKRRNLCQPFGRT